MHPNKRVFWVVGDNYQLIYTKLVGLKFIYLCTRQNI